MLIPTIYLKDKNNSRKRIENHVPTFSEDAESCWTCRLSLSFQVNVQVEKTGANIVRDQKGEDSDLWFQTNSTPARDCLCSTWAPMNSHIQEGRHFQMFSLHWCEWQIGRALSSLPPCLLDSVHGGQHLSWTADFQLLLLNNDELHVRFRLKGSVTGHRETAQSAADGNCLSVGRRTLSFYPVQLEKIQSLSSTVVCYYLHEKRKYTWQLPSAALT